MTTFVVSATVVTEDPEQVARSCEALARTSAGLLLEGINISVSMGVAEDEPEEKGDGD